MRLASQPELLKSLNAASSSHLDGRSTDMASQFSPKRHGLNPGASMEKHEGSNAAENQLIWIRLMNVPTKSFRLHISRHCYEPDIWRVLLEWQIKQVRAELRQDYILSNPPKVVYEELLQSTQA